MKDHGENRTLSTADLAGNSPTGDAPETDELDRRDEAGGRDDQLEGDADTEQSTAGAGTAATTDTDGAAALFDKAEVERFQSEWEAVQTGFVDEPRGAVERADTLVADLMQRLATGFAEERSQLEAQWDRGDEVSTEDLRVALQRYRSFFGRLLQA
jgi:hypothetical protein